MPANTYTSRILMILGIGCIVSLTACKHVSHSVTLTWQPPSSIVAFHGYNIYRAEASGGPYKLIASGVVNPKYIDSDVTSRKTYYYVVTTVDVGGGESRNSNEIAAKVP